jgi:hypothetical protein
VANDARDLEILVAKIQQQLAPNAEVIHDARLEGRLSGRQRQIDVLVRQRIGQYEMKIVLDCKDYARPVDVKGVEEFHGLIDDVGANKGALVCPRGFTEAAKPRAAGWQIDLYSPIDTDPHKWQVKVTAPCVCDFRSAMISFGFSCSAPKPFRLVDSFFNESIIQDESGKELGIALPAAMQKWNEGGFPIEAGEHRELPIFEKAEVHMDNGYGEYIPVTLTASLIVKQQLFFGNLPIAKVSGFKDELSGGIITNAFTTGIFEVDQVLREWLPINSIEEAPIMPMLSLRGLVAWSD